MSEDIRIIDLAEARDLAEVGAFNDADGTPVRCIDDVLILCGTKPDSDPASPHTIPPGTTATVLLFGADSRVVQLEYYWPGEAFGITYALTSDLGLYQRYEQKRSA